jgi:hypothetical protein
VLMVVSFTLRSRCSTPASAWKQRTDSGQSVLQPKGDGVQYMLADGGVFHVAQQVLHPGRTQCVCTLMF